MKVIKTETVDKKIAMIVATGFVAAMREFNPMQFEWLLQRSYSKLSYAADRVRDRKIKLSSLTFVNDFSELFYRRVYVTRHIKSRGPSAQYWDKDAFTDIDEARPFSVDESTYWPTVDSA